MLLFLINGCANVGFPEGGNKDATPPAVIKCAPQNFSTNFKEHEVVIFFNEYITLQNASTQIFISPAMQGGIETLLKGKSLHIQWTDSLRANTTYTLHFGNAIADLHEGNRLVDFQYVFSTGNFIDSCKLKGDVRFAENGNAAKQVSVLLYKNTSDTAFEKLKPDYYGITAADGTFTIEHISTGQYKIYALQDDNNSLTFDQPTESVAFYDSVIVVSDHNSDEHLLLFKSPASKQRLMNATALSEASIQLSFAKPTEQMKMISAGLLFTKWNTTNDTCLLWYNSLKKDSANIFLNDVGFSDTVSVSFKKTFEKNYKPSLKLNCNTASAKLAAGFNADSSITISFNHPLSKINSDSGFIMIDDSTKQSITLKTDSIKQQGFIEKIILNAPLVAEKKYTLYIMPKTCTDIFGLENDSAVFKFNTAAEKGKGNLTLQFVLPDSVQHYFFELTDKNGHVISRQKVTTTKNYFSFENLDAGSYVAKLISDQNENMQWDNGNYFLRQQPEKIFFYKTPIVIRQNWDVDVVLKTTE